MAALPAHAGKRPYGAGKTLGAAYVAGVNATFAPTTDAYDQAPRLVAAYQPMYPVSRLMSGIEGACEIRFRINAAGRTTAHEIVAPEDGQPAGDKKMCAHAIIAMRAWEFVPAMQAGVPVEYPDTIQLRFDYGF